MIDYHHARCMRDKAWDIENVPCTCPRGWPRKFTKKQELEFDKLTERNNWQEPPED